MKQIIKIIFLLVLFSCQNNLSRLAKSENQLKLDNFYSSYLALEYLEYSRSLASAKNWQDSEYFANKGILAGRGEKIFPESPIKWGVDNINREDAILSQKRLENVLTYEMQKLLPIQTAHLVFLYDCWISKDSKPAFRNGELSKCKSRFYKLLDEMEDYISDLKKDKKPATPILESDYERFEILFDLNNANFNDKANRKLIEIIKYLNNLNGNYRILLVGSADRIGKSLYNENLALRRVNIVKNYLLKNGVVSDLIETKAFGENFPDIITQKGTLQQSNRSVAIYVLSGAAVDSSIELPLPLIANQVYKNEIKKARQKRGLSN